MANDVRFHGREDVLIGVAALLVVDALARVVHLLKCHLGRLLDPLARLIAAADKFEIQIDDDLEALRQNPLDHDRAFDPTRLADRLSIEDAPDRPGIEPDLRRAGVRRCVGRRAA